MKYFLSLLLISLFSISCEDISDEGELANDNLPTAEGIEILTGYRCGWCAGSDSLYINSEIVSYTFSKCGPYLYDDQSNTDEDYWNEMLQLLDYEKFKSIDLNECGICYDGCDLWITINDGLSTHTILTDFRDSTQLEGITEFMEKLDAIRKSYREKVPD